MPGLPIISPSLRFRRMSKKLDSRLLPLESERIKARRQHAEALVGKKRRQKRRRLTLVFGGLLLAVTVIWHFSKDPAGPVPADITNRAQFTVFYPSKLPAGYTIDRDSFTFQDGTVIFTISGPKKQRLIFTQQGRPSNLDVKKLHKEQINQGTVVITPYGEAAIGILGPNLVASLLTEDAWILINDPSHGDRKVLSDIVKNLDQAD